MSKKQRKPTPSPPNWFWWDSDNCWDCNCNHNGCRNCKRLKRIAAQQRKKRDKNKIFDFYKNF